MQYSEIESLVDAGKTPAEIAAALNANPLHRRNAYITGGPSDTESVNVLHLLTARFRVMWQDKNQSWVGPLVDLAEVNPSIAQVMGMLYPHLQVKDSVVFCAQSIDSGNMVNVLTAAVCAVLPAGVGTASDVVAAVDLLTGGRIYGSVTEQQVQACINAETDRVTLAGLDKVADDYYQSVVTKYNIAKSGIADGSLTTASEVLAVLEGE